MSISCIGVSVAEIRKPVLSVNAKQSETVVIGTIVKFEVVQACPGWGVHLISITDGYSEVMPIKVADASGSVWFDHVVSKTLEVYVYSDCGGGNSNSVIVQVQTAATISCVTLMAVGGYGVIDITASWKNSGGTVGNFTPKVSLNGTEYILGSEVSLVAGETKTFTKRLTGLSFGSYTICPIPN